MRRCLFVLVLLTLVVTACSSSEPMAVEFTYPQEHGELPYSASGPAVDDGAVYSSGTKLVLRLENMAGEIITDEDWAVMFDSALEEGGVAEMMIYEEWTASDGSGSFTLEFHNVLDFAVFELQGRQNVGTWEITGGTGDYTELAGSGTVTLDWDESMASLTGEIEA